MQLFRKIFIALFVLFSIQTIAFSKDPKKIIQGFDGGMFLHTGYISGNISPINYKASGAPYGIGGVIRLHLWDNWRIGTEGYMSTLSQRGNGSYVEIAWGGILVDYRLKFGSFEPYIGITVGGGANKDLIMFEEPLLPWKPINNTIYQNQPFIAVTPFIGCEYALTDSMHLAVKFDYINAINKTSVPMGPRVYFGFIFSH